MADREQMLLELLEKISNEKNYKIRKIKLNEIMTGGANYTSKLFLISISSPDRDELKLFAKVVKMGEKLRKQMKADYLFGTEITVYTKLAKIYHDIEDQWDVPEEHRYVFPKFYGCTEDIGKETVVLENLIERGYKSFDRFKLMDWEHACAGVENLAKFHALSFAFAKYYPEKFDKLTVSMEYPLSHEFDKGLWMNTIENSLKAIKQDHRDAVRRFLLDDNCRLNKFNHPIGIPVIAHGDYRLSNLLYKKQGDTLNAIAVDYQTVYVGNAVCDLIYFIALGTDEDFREQYFDNLLEHYYTKLEGALKRLSVNPIEVYPKEKFYSDFKKMLPYAVLLGVAVLPVVIVEEDSAPKVDGDADINFLIIKPSEVAVQRFRGIVNDCIKWGVI